MVYEFANHTYTHPTFGSLSREAMLDEVERCRDVLVRLTGGPGAAFRPSGTDDGTTSPGDQALSVAMEAGYATVLGYDVDPLDYQDPGAAAITQRTLAAVKPEVTSVPLISPADASAAVASSFSSLALMPMA